MLETLGCKQVVIPEVRTRGKTGNMVQGMCHDNVAELVTRYGGKHLTGYSISKRKGNKTQVTLHSIWETPEGKFVEVTKTQSGMFRNADLFAVIHENKQRKSIKFPPLLETMVFEDSNVLVFQGFDPLTNLPYKVLKSRVKKSLSPIVIDYSVQSKAYWDYQKKLQECWEKVA